MEHEQTALLSGVQTYYTEIFTDRASDMAKRVRSEGRLDSLERKVDQYERILSETYHDHCSTGL